jgi:hypothetical protein
MRSCTSLFRLLLLTALFVVLVVAPSLAATSPGAALPAASTIQAPAPSATAFLATLSTEIPGGPSAILASGCTSSAQCPQGQLCCLACGAADCDTHACFTPIHGRCPLFP